MAVETLKLRGFKSFGKTCEFLFNKNFTAIVGPNGSGKSNILDALKWVLGEGSNSGLRITRQSDLLFQGSSSVSPAQDAEVIIKLSNENEQAVLRRTYSQLYGSSIFFDNKKILLQDLNGIKAGFALEGEGFALIGQGEIAEAISQRPKDRRRQLDVLFGIERYRERRNESLSKLEDALNEAVRIKTLIDELNTRRSEISHDVNIAVQAQGILDNLDVLRREYYFFRRNSLEEEQAGLELKKHMIASKLDSFQSWVNIWKLAMKGCNIDVVNSDGQESQQSLLENINSRKNALQRKAFQAASQVRDILRRRRELESELAEISSRKSGLESERERISTERVELSEELERKKKELSSRERAFKDSRAEIQRENERRKKILDETARLKISCSKIDAEIKALSLSRGSNNNELKLTETEHDEKSKALLILQSHKSELEKKCWSLSESCRQQSSTVQDIRRSLSRLQSQFEILRAEANSSLNAGIYPEPVRAILTASQKNYLHSRPEAAADVFSCESPKIAAAIEAYLGARQFYLLVHTLEEAQEGINFLKQHHAGRVTYLALERCRPRSNDFRVKLTLSGITGWAMNLVKIKSPWEDAISHMMGDLLIVELYNTASDLVRQGAKFPIVTLDGEVFSPSGTVSGGISTRQRLGMVVARQKLEAIKEKMSGLESGIAEMEKNLDENTKLEKNFRREFENASNELENVKSDLNSQQRVLNSLSNALGRLRSESFDSEKQSAILEAKLKEARNNLAGLEKEIESFSEIKDMNYDFTSLKNELSFLQERMKVIVALSERTDQDYKNAVSRIESINRELNSGEQNESKSRETLFSLGREKLENYHEELKVRREIASREKEFLKARKRFVRLNSKLERANANLISCRGDLAELENKLSHLRNEFTQLTELWDEKYPYNKKQAREVEGGRELTSSLRKLERELKSLGQYNLGTLSEDQSLTERIDFLSEQLDDVDSASEELKIMIQETDKQVESTFTSAMRRIDERFNQLFQRLFGGGEARMHLQEGENIWDRGVEIFARPPGKKLQNISQLSGGEQSLTAIAQIFSVLEVAGTPLAVLDEVDAALDEYNLIRFADLAKEYSRSIQIIAMTHRRATMERADLIYGVTMIEPGLSQTVGIDPENYK